MDVIKTPCSWAETNELFIPYHDNEWGTPEHDDRMLFEMLNLEGAQAGLSWITILKRREGYRKAFDNFDANTIAAYTETKKQQLMQDTNIIRNRLKIEAVIQNAKTFLSVQKEYGSFDAYIWKFVNGQPIPYSRREEAIAMSETVSKELKKKGFKFVGPTICFAFMQAVGMVNDHGPECFRYKK